MPIPVSSARCTCLGSLADVSLMDHMAPADLTRACQTRSRPLHVGTARSSPSAAPHSHPPQATRACRRRRQAHRRRQQGALPALAPAAEDAGGGVAAVRRHAQRRTRARRLCQGHGAHCHGAGRRGRHGRALARAVAGVPGALEDTRALAPQRTWACCHNCAHALAGALRNASGR